jgi:hypothetical protein
MPDELHERLRAKAFASRVNMTRPLAAVEEIAHDGRLSEGIDVTLYNE